MRFFIGDIDNVTAVAAFSEVSDVEAAITDWLLINSEYDRLIVTDIIGGSINQIAYHLLKEHNFYLISGMNLGLMLEIMFMDKMTEEKLNLAINQNREQIILMNSYTIDEEEEEF